MLNSGDRLRLAEDKFRISGVIASTRQQVIDDSLPTLAELGINFVEVPSPISVLIPAGVPDDVAGRLSETIRKATARESLWEGMERTFNPVTHLGPEVGSAYIRQLRENVKTLIRKRRK